MKYILAHDLGTSGNKATLLAQSGELAGSEVSGYGVRYFNANWAEQDPRAWWKAVCDSTRALLNRVNVAPENIAAVSFSGQMMGCLCVDRQGKPLRDAIIWADQRAQAQAEQLSLKITPEEHYRLTGHRNTASYGLPKLMWVRDHEPSIYRDTFKVFNAKDYIVFRMTGAFLTEPTDASGFNCLDLPSRTWSERLIDAAGIDAGKFPEIQPSTHIAGGITEAAALETGLLSGTPVVLGGGDGLCANVGAGSVRVGKTYCYLGSSSWIAASTDQPLLDERQRIVTWPHIVPGLYAPNGAMQTAGGAYHWFRTQVCQKETQEALQQGLSPYDLINREIEQSPPGANGVIFLPYLLGERSPHWNPDARGAFIGLKMENSHADLARSVLEGITLNLHAILEVFRNALPIHEVLVIGGGAKGAVWRQIMADLFAARICVPALLEESTSIGAAVTGGVGVGLFPDFRVAEDMISIRAVHEPSPEAVRAYGPVKELFDLCYTALEGVFSAMSRKG